MAIEATGTTSYSQNPSGVGAVYLSPQVNLLDSHYKNLQMFDEGQQRRREEESKKQEVAAKMFKDLKLDSEGILDRDVPFFQDRIKKANDFLVEGYKAGYDPTKAGAGAFYNTYKKMLDETQLLMNRSKSDRLAAVEATKQAVEKGDPKLTADRVYEWASRPITERATGDWSKLFVGKPNSFIEIVDKNVPHIKLDETESVFNLPDGQTGVKKVSGKSDADVASIAQGWAAEEPDGLEADWTKAGKTAQNFYASQLDQIKAGQDTPLKNIVADMTPQEYFAYKQVRTKIPSNNVAIDNLRYSPYSEAKAKGRAESETEYEGAGALWDLVRGVAQDNLAIFDNYDVSNGKVIVDPKAPNELIATQFEPIRVSVYPNPYEGQSGVLPENIVAVKKIKGDKNSVYVKTDKIAFDPADKSKVLPNEWKKLDLNTFANKVFANNYKGQKGTDDAVQGLEALKYFAKKSGNYNNGTVDFTSTLGAGSTLNRPLTVTGQREQGTFDVGEQGQITPKIATKQPTPKTITLSDAKKANPNFKGTDADLIEKYKKFGYTVK